MRLSLDKGAFFIIRSILVGEELTVNYYQDYRGEESPQYALKQLLKVRFIMR